MIGVKVVSGGQTGADRAALDFALAREIECGGWCPRGRVAEDGAIPAKYPLRETPEPTYPPRTRRNVEDSDATVIFDAASVAPSRGTKLTINCCKSAGKPFVVLSAFPDVAVDAEALAAFLAKIRPQVLNVAGNRESGTPGIYAHVFAVLVSAWDR